MSETWEYKPIGVLDVAIVDCLLAEDLADQADHIVSLWDHGTYALEKYPWVTKENVHVFEFDDVLGSYGDFIAPTLDQIEKILDKARYFKGKVLIHCAAGISRSSAVALGVIALHHPDLTDDQCVDLWKQHVEQTFRRKWRDCPVAPNREILRLVDLCLHRNLRQAWKDSTIYRSAFGEVE